METIKSEPGNTEIKTEIDVVSINKLENCEDEVELPGLDDSDTSTICDENRNDDIDTDFKNDQIVDREINASIEDMERALLKTENIESNVEQELNAEINDMERDFIKVENVETKIEVVRCPIQEQNFIESESIQEKNFLEPESDSFDPAVQQTEIPEQIPVLEFKSDDTFDNLYKTRLEKKIKEARENVQKFSETVKYQHTPFMRVIENNEKAHDGFFCKFVEPRQCPIEKSLSGKWRLKLHKNVERLDVTDESPLTPENSKAVFSIKRTNEFIKEEEDAESDLPPYVSVFIKYFEDFLNNNPEVQMEASRDDNDTKTERKEFYELHLHSNFKFEMMAVVMGYRNLTPKMKDALSAWCLYACNQLKLVSLYLRTMGHNRKTFYTDHIYGDRKMTEYVGHIKLNISPTMNFYSNVSGVELYYETLVEFMKPSQYKTILVIGGGLGLIPLLLSKDTRKVVAIIENNMMKDALFLQKTNDIRNVEFIEFENTGKIDKQLNYLKDQNFFVVIDNNTNCGRSPQLLDKIHNLLSLKYIVILSTFKMHHAKPLVKFFEPIDSENGCPFYPEKGCVVDPTPSSGHFQVVVVLKRYAITKFKQDRRTGTWIPAKPISKSQTSQKGITVKEFSRDSLSRSSDIESPCTSAETDQIKPSQNASIEERNFKILKRETGLEDNPRLQKQKTVEDPRIQSKIPKIPKIIKSEPSNNTSETPGLKETRNETVTQSSFLDRCKSLKRYLDKMKNLTQEEKRSSKIKSSVVIQMEKYVDSAYVHLNALTNGLSQMKSVKSSDSDKKRTEDRDGTKNSHGDSRKRKSSAARESNAKKFAGPDHQ